MILHDDYYFEDGETKGDTVYERTDRDSKVLDQHGRPYVVMQQVKIGFDLRRKT